MDSKQRILAALRREELDRIPVVLHGYGEPFLRRHFDPARKQHDMGEKPSFNPNLNLVETQLDAHLRLGFDPIIWMTPRMPPCEWGTWADDYVLHRWQNAPCDTWMVRECFLEQQGNNLRYAYIIETTEGELTCKIENEPGHTRWILENPIKREDDISKLRFRPDPSSLPVVKAVNHQLETIGEKGVGIIHVPGVWHQACDLRGFPQLVYDTYDRPQWVDHFFEILRDYLVEFVIELSTSNLEVMILNESHLGLGISPTLFERFIFQHDKAVVDAANKGGLLTIFHNCGRSDVLLEGMAETGASAVETLAPSPLEGDVSLDKAKQRIGKRVCLRGGMDTAVIAKGDTEAITREVRRCLSAAAKGGGYIMGTAQPIYEAPFESLQYLADISEKLSTQYM